MREQESLSKYGGRYWRMFILKAYGRENSRNLKSCPTIAALLRQDRSIQSVTLSFLEAGKHIPSHRGPFRGILRYHLGLVIPKDAEGRSLAGLRIDGEAYALQEGAGLLWDDTYLHEAWNHGDSVRAALLIDVIRPGMPRLLTWMTKLIIASVGFSIVLGGQEGW
jgi:aspartate beta-hydroxylase